MGKEVDSAKHKYPSDTNNADSNNSPLSECFLYANHKLISSHIFLTFNLMFITRDL